MEEPEPDVGSDAGVELTDLPDPPALDGYCAKKPAITPKQQLLFYSADEWEEFILEWVQGLKRDYHQLKRLGGPGDESVDIAAFVTADGFEGEWDCFQGKHYERALQPADAYTEMVKVLEAVVAKSYKLPRRYVFVAPHGCGPTLNRLLSKPTGLGSAFTKYLDKIKYSDAEVLALAKKLDYSLFASGELHEVLEVHSTTKFHATRFGLDLPSRGADDSPPDDIDAKETRYVAQIVEAYEDAYPGTELVAAELSSNPDHGEHFRRQRQAFYSAESLRLYARDAVPDGTYEALQEDVYHGVVDVADDDHAHGLARMRRVMMSAGTVDLSSHALLAVSRTRDRHGICHQLANADRLTWVPD